MHSGDLFLFLIAVVVSEGNTEKIIGTRPESDFISQLHFALPNNHIYKPGQIKPEHLKPERIQTVLSRVHHSIPVCHNVLELL